MKLLRMTLLGTLCALAACGNPRNVLLGLEAASVATHAIGVVASASRSNYYRDGYGATTYAQPQVADRICHWSDGSVTEGWCPNEVPRMFVDPRAVPSQQPYGGGYYPYHYPYHYVPVGPVQMPFYTNGYGIR
jgi:hypothetical protein